MLLLESLQINLELKLEVVNDEAKDKSTISFLSTENMVLVRKVSLLENKIKQWPSKTSVQYSALGISKKSI